MNIFAIRTVRKQLNKGLVTRIIPTKSQKFNKYDTITPITMNTTPITPIITTSSRHYQPSKKFSFLTKKSSFQIFNQSFTPAAKTKTVKPTISSNLTNLKLPFSTLFQRSISQLKAPLFSFPYIPTTLGLTTRPILFSMIGLFHPTDQTSSNIPTPLPATLSRDLDIDYYANEEHYKEPIKYVDTADIVVNIRQIQRIIMKDAFLCKKYCRYIIETIEDSKKIIEQAEKRLGTMIQVTEHEPTNEIYRNYILKLDEEREALDGYLNLGLLCVMPVATITKHFKGILDEKHNDGGLGAEFILAQEQFDIVHQQLNQLQELSAKCDGLIELSDQCVQNYLKEMSNLIENLQDNKLPINLSQYNGQQPLSSIYFDQNGRSTNKYVPEAEIERVFLEINDPIERNKELERIYRENRKKQSNLRQNRHNNDVSSVKNYRNEVRQNSPVANEILRAPEGVELESVYDDNGTWLGAKVKGSQDQTIYTR